MTKITNKLFLIFPIIFIFEMVFGYTGTLMMFGKVSLRVVIFLMSFLSLYAYSLFYVIKNKIKIFDLKDKNSVLGGFNIIDWSFLVLFVSTLFSMIVIPYFYRNIPLALDEIRDSVAMMSLFFPASFLIKKKQIDFNFLENYIKILIFGLAVLHIALYIGQSYNSMFLRHYFETLIKFFGGNGIHPPIILGHGGYVRIIYSTSIFLIIGIYLFLKNIDNAKPYDYLFFYSEIVAILTTMTKSIWLGMAIGLLIYILGYSYNKAKMGKKKEIVKLGAVMLGALLMTVALDFTMFSGMVSVRLGNTFIHSSLHNDSPEEKEEIKESDKEGAVISNDIKIHQMKLLFEKWKSKPIIGYGYGSYVEGYLRSESSPFSYEMTLFAMLMKIGILGMLCWGFFVISMIVFMCKNCKSNAQELYSWLFLIVSFGAIVQTNPFLLNFSGIGFLIVIGLTCVNKYVLNCEEKTIKE